MTTKVELGLGAVRECDLDLTIGELARLGKFIQLCMDEAIAAERERCAKVVDKHAELGYNNAQEIAAAIRARAGGEEAKEVVR